MTTSGVTTLTMTAREVIEFALGELNAVPIGQESDITELAPILRKLNVMVKGWEVKGPHLWRTGDGSTQLVAGQGDYSLTLDNPLRIKEVRYRYPDGHDLPMVKMSRTQYETLPNKNSAGVPTQWYFNPQSTYQVLFIWPVPRVVTTDTLRYSYQQRFQICQTLDDDVDIPTEWLDTVGMNLAARLLDAYGSEGESAARIEKEAALLLRAAKAFDRPDFVCFMPSGRPRGN